MTPSTGRAALRAAARRALACPFRCFTWPSALDAKVAIVDGRLEMAPAALVAELAKEAVCLGVTTPTGPALADALEVTRAAKAARHGLPVVWGGPHATFRPAECLATGLVDACVIGGGRAHLGGDRGRAPRRGRRAVDPGRGLRARRAGRGEPRPPARGRERSAPGRLRARSTSNGTSGIGAPAGWRSSRAGAAALRARSGAASWPSDVVGSCGTCGLGTRWPTSSSWTRASSSTAARVADIAAGSRPRRAACRWEASANPARSRARARAADSRRCSARAAPAASRLFARGPRTAQPWRSRSSGRGCGCGRSCRASSSGAEPGERRVGPATPQGRPRAPAPCRARSRSSCGSSRPGPGRRRPRSSSPRTGAPREVAGWAAFDPLSLRRIVAARRRARAALELLLRPRLATAAAGGWASAWCTAWPGPACAPASTASTWSAARCSACGVARKALRLRARAPVED